MAEELRWGIIGAANFAAQHMGPAIHAARMNRLVALATSTESKAEAAASSEEETGSGEADAPAPPGGVNC